MSCTVVKAILAMYGLQLPLPQRKKRNRDPVCRADKVHNGPETCHSPCGGKGEGREHEHGQQPGHDFIT